MGYTALFHIAQQYKGDKKVVTDLIRAVAFNLQRLEEEELIDTISDNTANLAMDKIMEFVEKVETDTIKNITTSANKLITTSTDLPLQSLQDRAVLFLDTARATTTAIRDLAIDVTNRAVAHLEQSAAEALQAVQSAKPTDNTASLLTAIQTMEE